MYRKETRWAISSFSGVSIRSQSAAVQAVGARMYLSVTSCPSSLRNFVCFSWIYLKIFAVWCFRAGIPPNVRLLCHSLVFTHHIKPKFYISYI